MATYGAPQPPPGPPQPPAAPVSAPRWRVLRWSCYAVYAALGATIVAIVAALVTQIEQRGLVTDTEFSDLARLFELDDRVESLNDAFLVVALVTLVTTMVWMWRAAKNNQALGRTHPRFGPGWSIGGWLIPVAFLVIPVLVMQDLWRGSDSSVPRGDQRWKIADRSLLVGFWWGLLLFGRVLIVAGGGIVDQGPENLQSGLDLQILGNVCSLAAAVLAILVVRRITERQTESLRVQNEQWRQQSGGAVAPAIEI